MNDANSSAEEIGAGKVRMEQTPGSILRRLREDAGLSHSVVGEALHLTAHYVKALESDEYGKLPALTFVKGYLRSYARFMKADVDAVMASYEQYIASLVDEGQRTEQVQRSRRRHDQALRWAIATSVILVLGIAGGWWFKGKDSTAAASSDLEQPAADTSTPRTATPPAATRVAATQASGLSQSAEPSVSPDIAAQSALTARLVPAFGAAAADLDGEAGMAAGGAAIVPGTSTAALLPSAAGDAGEPQALHSGDVLTVTPAEDGSRHVNLVSSGDDLLELTFSGNCWVEIADGANIRLYNAMLGSGDALTVHGAAPFQLLLGDAANVSVSFNSEAVNIASDIRNDNTARLVLANPATATAAAQMTEASP